MTEMLNNLIGAVSGFLYDPWVPLFLVVAGVVLTVWTGFPQIRMLVESFRVVMEKPKNADGMSSFGALMISTASRVGTGNMEAWESCAPVTSPAFWDEVPSLAVLSPRCWLSGLDLVAPFFSRGLEQVA